MRARRNDDPAADHHPADHRPDNDGSATTTTAPPTTTPPTGHFNTLPVGATLPSEQQCATAVRRMSENRPDERDVQRDQRHDGEHHVPTRDRQLHRDH